MFRQCDFVLLANFFAAKNRGAMLTIDFNAQRHFIFCATSCHTRLHNKKNPLANFSEAVQIFILFLGIKLTKGHA